MDPYEASDQLNPVLLRWIALLSCILTWALLGWGFTAFIRWAMSW